MWIFSHHIYSTRKRKLIRDVTQELNLHGFVRPGKPGKPHTNFDFNLVHNYNIPLHSLTTGFICVEGKGEDIEDFWRRIRHENWQRISVIDRYTLDPQEDYLFEPFQELLYGQSDFFKFLQEHKCDTVIKDYLGIPQ